MSKKNDVWDFIKKKAEEEKTMVKKEIEKLYKQLENKVKQDFNENFPELAKGEWSKTYRVLNIQNVEIIIDNKIKLKVVDNLASISYIPIFTCKQCKGEIKGNPIYSYIDLVNSKKNFCRICEIINVYKKFSS